MDTKTLESIEKKREELATLERAAYSDAVNEMRRLAIAFNVSASDVYNITKQDAKAFEIKKVYEKRAKKAKPAPKKKPPAQTKTATKPASETTQKTAFTA